MENDAQSQSTLGRSILWLVVLALIVVGGFAIGKQKETSEGMGDQSPKAESADFFTRNQECLKYKDDIAKKLGERDSSLHTVSLEQIFYSPRVNSCVYVAYYDATGYGFFDEKMLFDILNDGNSATPLEYYIDLSPPFPHCCPTKVLKDTVAPPRQSRIC